ncbi:hypothetical protein HCG51_13225 [Tolypothrix sp. PCC 7910]|uniref:hypothetical protein n=1 Tax=Tolypothrix sp. PCC 7910 TaxID=2099387 RepID=UPI0014277AED|nr:hypothetical protein [Tolypothrix sp. PCC 7910]QIR37576.1 hypothetical protein HCG51_13225 [Tolypothrix sp. PCC 7910]
MSQIFTAVGFIGYLCFTNRQKVVNNLAEQLTAKVHQVGFLNLLNFRGSGRYFYQAIQIFKDIGYKDYIFTKSEAVGVRDGYEDIVKFINLYMIKEK